jgi:topoisomerase-4 subunit A
LTDKQVSFPLSDVPGTNRDSGVTLQKVEDGGSSDARVHPKREGYSWWLSEETKIETDLKLRIGQRAQDGNLPPNGFPKN